MICTVERTVCTSIGLYCIKCKLQCNEVIDHMKCQEIKFASQVICKYHSYCLSLTITLYPDNSANAVINTDSLKADTSVPSDDSLQTNLKPETKILLFLFRDGCKLNKT